VYGPEAIRRICERLSREVDDARCNELIAQLRMVVEEDREELSGRLQFLASRFLREESDNPDTDFTHSHRSRSEKRRGLVIILQSNPSEYYSPRE
jgi:SET domain-containing protein